MIPKQKKEQLWDTMRVINICLILFDIFDAYIM
jgi:hypothetical protein